MSLSVEALTLAPAPAARAGPSLPLARLEKLALGAELTLAMLAGGLVLVALGWEWAFPHDRDLASLAAGLAALLVAGPVLAAAWLSLSRPSLHGVADLLVARGAAAHGLTWHFARPPIVGLEYEMDVRAVHEERVIA